jgi:hypothetical protein
VLRSAYDRCIEATVTLERPHFSVCRTSASRFKKCPSASSTALRMQSKIATLGASSTSVPVRRVPCSTCIQNAGLQWSLRHIAGTVASVNDRIATTLERPGTKSARMLARNVSRYPGASGIRFPWYTRRTTHRFSLRCVSKRNSACSVRRIFPCHRRRY